MTSLPIPRKSPHAERCAETHDRLTRQIATGPLRQPVSKRRPLPEDPIHRPRINERDAIVAGLGDEVRNLLRRIRMVEKDYEELRERVRELEGAA